MKLKEIWKDILQYDEEREEIIVPPYYKVIYIDDCGYKHLATIKDINYLTFLKDRFIILECKLVAA